MAPFHVLGHKCKQCGGYADSMTQFNSCRFNTKITALHRAQPGEQAEADVENGGEAYEAAMSMGDADPNEDDSFESSDASMDYEDDGDDGDDGDDNDNDD